MYWTQWHAEHDPEPAPEPDHPFTCLYCRDLGINARTNLACLQCAKGRALLLEQLQTVQPLSLTDKLTHAWRMLHDVQSDAWPTMSDNSRLQLERDMWEAERRLRDAIDHMADMETVVWLQRGKAERQAVRLRSLADQDTMPL